LRAGVRAALGWAAFAVLPAAAEVYKCAGNDRIPIYQDAPCPAGKELRNFQTDPPEITVLPAPEASADKSVPPESRRPPRERAAPAATAKRSDPKTAGNAGERKFLRPGMTEGEVIAKVGHPEVTSRGGKPPTHRWTYLPADGDGETITVVTFANGVVADIVRKVVK
jgi:hypothetical protein